MVGKTFFIAAQITFSIAIEGPLYLQPLEQNESGTGNMQLPYYSQGPYLIHVLFSQFVFFPINGPGRTSGKPRYKRTVFLIGMERQLLQPKELSVERKVLMLLANCIMLCNREDLLSCLCEFRSENKPRFTLNLPLLVVFLPQVSWSGRY